MNLFDGIAGVLGDKAGNFDLNSLASALGDGGISGIVQNLSQGGLGDIVQSWIGNGENLPVSLDQLQAIIGSEQVTKIASSLGIDPSQIADVLPGLIDKLTPGGALPQGGLGDVLGNVLGQSGGQLGGGLGDLIGGFLKR